MLCLRDPADETNDLGRKAAAIKHVQATFKQVCFDLNRDLAVNTRPSLLAPMVGTSYMLDYERRKKLRYYGHRLSSEMNLSLAEKAKAIRDGEAYAEATKQSDEEMERARRAREERTGSGPD
jgi:non-canonical poly(A) RNA polymerase PAPD5/7